MKKDKELLISPSLFTLFIFLLINERWMYADYILQDRIPRSVIDNLRKLGLKVTYIRSGDSFGSSSFAKLLRGVIKNLEYLRVVLISKLRNKYKDVYGNDEVLESVPFRKYGIKLIEDGSFNLQSRDFFVTRVKKMHRFLFTRLFNSRDIYSYVPYGYSCCVNKIYLTHKNAVNKDINHKAEFVPIRDLWEKRSVEEKACIQNIFGITNQTAAMLSRFPYVLLTQPLGKNEGGFMKESEKIAIYSQLLKGIPLNKLLIKTHYAEKTNYRKYFRESLIIDQPIPFQFFELLDYRPSKVITISSSAALKYKSQSCDIIFTGTEIDDRIVKMYGVVRI